MKHHVSIYQYSFALLNFHSFYPRLVWDSIVFISLYLFAASAHFLDSSVSISSLLTSVLSLIPSYVPRVWNEHKSSWILVIKDVMSAGGLRLNSSCVRSRAHFVAWAFSAWGDKTFCRQVLQEHESSAHHYNRSHQEWRSDSGGMRREAKGQRASGNSDWEIMRLHMSNVKKWQHGKLQRDE